MFIIGTYQKAFRGVGQPIWSLIKTDLSMGVGDTVYVARLPPSRNRAERIEVRWCVNKDSLHNREWASAVPNILHEIEWRSDERA